MTRFSSAHALLVSVALYACEGTVDGPPIQLGEDGAVTLDAGRDDAGTEGDGSTPGDAASADGGVAEADAGSDGGLLDGSASDGSAGDGGAGDGGGGDGGGGDLDGGGSDLDGGGPDAAPTDAASGPDGGDGAVTPRIVDVYVAAPGARKIVRYELDPASLMLLPRGETTTTAEAGPLAANPDGSRLYAAANDSIETFSIQPSTGSLTSLGLTTSGGDGVYLAVTADGAFALAAHYRDGLVTSHRVGTNGLLTAPPSASVMTTTQPHSIVQSPDPRWVFVPHRSGNVVRQFVFDPATGALTANTPTDVPQPMGRGPRHMTFHPTVDVAYVANELDDTVSVYALDRATGRLTETDNLTTLPPGADGAMNTVADIHVTPDGRALYVSNRGDDSIAMFSVDAAGDLTARGHAPTEARPRDFGMDPRGRVIVVAGQDTGFVRVHAIESDGTLREVHRIVAGDDARWVLMLER